MATRHRAGLVIACLLTSFVTASCSSLFVDVHILSSDAMQGRNNATPGSLLAQNHLIGELKHIAVGLDPSGSGADAFRQPFDGGTNVLALIPGDELANEYVIVGAHYDHLGNTCRSAEPGDNICNGATDNAAGVAAVLSIGREIAQRPDAPRRSVVLALWDREEDGLVGSRFYVQHPLVPLSQTVAYVNYDIQGANLLPSLRRTTFAVGSETGGHRLVSLVEQAAGRGPLQTRLVSSIFGQGRSDYVNFINAQVPTVFFSDSTGPCYHTVQDEARVVDFWKLRHQAKIGYDVVSDLVDGDRPAFATSTPLATFEDAVVLLDVANAALADLGRFDPTQQALLLGFRDDLVAVVTAGPANFGDDDVTALLTGAVDAVNTLTSGECDGFLAGGD